MLSKIFKEQNGKIVLWQNPNIPLIAWIICTLATKVLPVGQLKDLTGILAFGAIFTWAYLEITDGASYFRRILGAVIIVFSVINKLR